MSKGLTQVGAIMSLKRLILLLLFLLSPWNDTFAGLIGKTAGAYAYSDSALTEQQYFATLDTAGAETFERDFEPYFLLLLAPEQKKAYRDLRSLDEKKYYMRYFWEASNPNPLMSENRWLLEYLRRVHYAKKHYRRASPPFVDDRGIYYIKYGKPRRQYADPGGPTRMGYKILRNSPTRLFYSTIPNETWSYENIQDGFVVYFVQEGISFRETTSLYDAVLDRRIIRGAMRKSDPNLEYYVWGDMIKRRESISPALAETAIDIRSVESGFNLFGGSPQGQLRLRAEKALVDRQLARERAPSAAAEPIPAKRKLEFTDRFTQLRGPNGKTRIEIALLAPFEKNLVKKIKQARKDTLKLQFSGMLRDADFDPIIRNDAMSSIIMKSVSKKELPNAVGKFMLLARPQNAELTLQVTEKKHDKIGFSRQPIEIRDFSGRELMISDIVLYYEAKTEVEKKTLPVIRKQGLPVSPYPFEKINKKKPPLVYFEIYNIRAAGIRERLNIAYRIAALEKENKNIFQAFADALSRPDRASVTVTYTRLVMGENMEELIALDLRGVKNGRHLLEVAVSSPQDSTIRAVARTELAVGK